MPTDNYRNSYTEIRRRGAACIGFDGVFLWSDESCLPRQTICSHDSAERAAQPGMNIISIGPENIEICGACKDSTES
jgi:hypothetical protein